MRGRVPDLAFLGAMLSFTLSSFEVRNIPQGAGVVVAEFPFGLIGGAHSTSGLDVLSLSSVASPEPLVPVPVLTTCSFTHSRRNPCILSMPSRSHVEPEEKELAAFLLGTLRTGPVSLPPSEIPGPETIHNSISYELNCVPPPPQRYIKS